MDALLDVAQESLFRLSGAVVLGAAVGVHRHLHHRPAGVRTHALVALASAAVTLGCSHGLSGQASLAPAVQGVVTGVGFLGAGVIMRPSNERDVLGLTTAASIWLVAALGAVLGLGQWMVVLPAAFLTALVLTAGGRLEEAIARRAERQSAANRGAGGQAPGGGPSV